MFHPRAQTFATGSSMALRQHAIPLVAALVLAATAAGVRAAALDWSDFHARMQSARAVLVAHFAQIDRRSRMAANLEERLDSQLGLLSAGSKPAYLQPSLYLDYALTEADLDASLIGQLASGHPHNLSAVHGADDVPFRAVADGLQQPLGVFVPESYDSHVPAPLVVMLHGFSQTEADEIAAPWIRSIANATGAIVAAPYARGDVHYAGLAPQDIYQTVALMRHAFAIDPKRVYLAGHSMGGLGIFTVGTLHPDTWAAFLCVSGAMTEDDKNTALERLTTKPVYLVEGSDDQVVPALYVRRTARLLDSAGIPVRYYEQAGGQHSLGTIAQSFSHAWRDMLAGVTTRLPIPPDQ